MRESDAFLESLQEPRPDPGGGSAAAHGALMAVSLLQKVAMLEKKRARPAGDAKEGWDETLEELRRLGDDLLRLRTEDVEAYRVLAEALKAGYGKTRRDEAAEAASQVPLAIMKTAADALQEAAAVGRRCADHLRADVAVAAEFLGAAVQAAFWIGRANALLIQNPERRVHLLEILRNRRDAGVEDFRAVRRELGEHGEARSR